MKKGLYHFMKILMLRKRDAKGGQNQRYSTDVMTKPLIFRSMMATCDSEVAAGGVGIDLNLETLRIFRISEQTLCRQTMR